MYKLRGHHLFCLLGYRGMGYSEEYVENMTHLHQNLSNDPETLIQIIKGPDQLCEKYPNSGKYHCQDDHIYERDAAILEKLGLKIGQILQWKNIESHIRKFVVPSDIQIVCETCSWRSYGVCEEGIQEIHEGKGLRKIK
ncbi:DUF1284 domain-containing protein [Cytobacillus depressus]|uniref:DUF1284 domain-containing protein n=1 Tax=Cytobacillus depressus TaxID=1602942 RepID=A0A6L3V3L4_9BACI|nr:DUF1284 domain-containing protein [Cytobacillus depressus]KAB2334520.1 DUF1284 domain-containing protein [Cytobacillus depressus]